MANKQKRDPWVLEVQEWLNQTYSGQAGFNEVEQDGYTGWETIYGLIRALQIELGLTPADNFGDGTKAAWDSQVAGKLVPGWKSNIVKLIDGANRCKGIGQGKFLTEYTSDNQETLQQLKTLAGFESPDTAFGSMWAKALFDMSAFVLISSGDSVIRKIQQNLNRNYFEYTGILPCDGVYQRETNKALIYGLQAEIGMAVGVANGNYGPGTEAGTPTLQEGSSGNFVSILQYGLYVNGFNKEADFSGIFSSGTGSEIQKFRQFMALSPFTQVSDLTVMKGLLTSNGNTNRAAQACDTSTILTLETATQLKNNGFEIVGRYLTGTVGTGEDERDKSLSLQEISSITKAGLSIFPIYQDGGWYESYFTEPQGKIDGQKAVEAAFNLGFPYGTTIYFACDVDILDGNIAGTVLPYFKAVSAYVYENGYYSVGVYGTRNVCQKVIDKNYAEQCFVSNMSSGFSGNLGFAMPQTWAFDQFIETTSAGVGIDKVAVSGRDSGAKTFANDGETLAKRELIPLMNKIANGGIKKDRGYISDFSFQWGKKYRFNIMPNFYVCMTPDYEWTLEDEDLEIGFEIKNGEADISLPSLEEQISDALESFDTYLSGSYSDAAELISELAPTVGNGIISTGLCVDENLLIGTKIIFAFEKEFKTDQGTLTAKYQLKLEFYNRPLSTSPIPGTVYERIANEISEGTYAPSKGVIGGNLVVGIGLALVTLVAIGVVVALAAPIVAAIAAGVSTAAEALFAFGFTLFGILAT